MYICVSLSSIFTYENVLLKVNNMLYIGSKLLCFELFTWNVIQIDSNLYQYNNKIHC